MAATQTTKDQRRIVVAVDGSPSSNEALAWAVRQAALTGSVVEAVTAWHYPTDVGEYAYVGETDWAANALSIQDTAVKEVLGDDTGSLIRGIVQGHPVPVLLAAAVGAELLVMGSRGHGGFTGLLLGSVSEHVVGHAPCAVVVVRPPLAAEDLTGSSGAGSARAASR
jgi:nucleotide-binding universal stress UspA family protein